MFPLFVCPQFVIFFRSTPASILKYQTPISLFSSDIHKSLLTTLHPSSRYLRRLRCQSYLLRSCRCPNCHCLNCRLRNCHCPNCHLRNCHYPNCRLRNCHCPNCRLRNCHCPNYHCRTAADSRLCCRYRRLLSAVTVVAAFVGFVCCTVVFSAALCT